MSKINDQIANIKKIIPKNDIKDVESLMTNLSEDQSQFVYKKFTDAQKEIENIYISIAFKDSTDGQKLIKTVLESIQK